MKLITILLLVVVFVLFYVWCKKRSEGFDDYRTTYYPVSKLHDEYLADMPTYSNCPYIRLPARPENWPPKLKVYGPGDIERLRSKKWVYSDNPIYNFF